MANSKSAKKRALQNNKRRKVNVARKTSLKTIVKKVLDAVKTGDYETSMTLLKEAEAKFARAKGKVVHANTAARKTSRLAKKVATLAKKK